MADAESIRLRALKALRDLLGTMTKDETPPSIVAAPGLSQDVLRFSLDVDNIVFAPLTETQFKKNLSVGILEGDHTLNHQMQVDTNILSVTLEIFHRMDNSVGDDGASCWNALLTDFQRLIRSDPTLGGLIANVEIIGDSVDVESYLDKKIDAAIFLRFNYKTAENDPRQRVPGVIPA